MRPYGNATKESAPPIIIPKRSYGEGFCAKHGTFQKMNANQVCCSNSECQRVFRNEQAKARARKRAGK